MKSNKINQIKIKCLLLLLSFIVWFSLLISSFYSTFLLFFSFSSFLDVGNTASFYLVSSSAFFTTCSIIRLFLYSSISIEHYWVCLMKIFFVFPWCWRKTRRSKFFLINKGLSSNRFYSPLSTLFEHTPYIMHLHIDGVI